MRRIVFLPLSLLVAVVAYDVEAGGREEIPHPRDCPYPPPQMPWTQPEFDFIVGIDEPQFAVDDSSPAFTCQTFKHLDSHPRRFDVHHLVDACLRFAARLQHGAVECPWQQVQERPVRHQTAAAYLLMPPEWHLPCRERHEDHAALADVPPEVGDETPLVRDVLKHVVAQHHVKRMLYVSHLEDVRRDKRPPCPSLGEEASRVADAVDRDVNTGHIQPHPCQRQQVAAVAATNLKHPHAWAERLEPRDVGDKPPLARRGEFVEVLLPVALPLLHLVVCMVVKRGKINDNGCRDKIYDAFPR